MLVGRTPRRNPDARVQPVQYSQPADEARPCSRRRRGTGPHLSASSGDLRVTEAFCFRAEKNLGRSVSVSWGAETKVAHADYLAWTDRPLASQEMSISARSRSGCGTISPPKRCSNGAGNYAAWIHRYYRFRQFATHIAPTSASMGYGVPAAVAMQRLYPGRLVLSLNGDGDFLMNGQEFATAVQYQLPIVAIVCDNGSYGTIRMHQERAYPGRTIATELRNPRFRGLRPRVRRLRHRGGQYLCLSGSFCGSASVGATIHYSPQN